VFVLTGKHTADDRSESAPTSAKPDADVMAGSLADVVAALTDRNVLHDVLHHEGCHA
jgi:hypothetical protein